MLLEKTQRRLCRLLFCVGCLVPTLAITGWAVARFHPAAKTAWLESAGEQLGYQVICDQLRTPRPGLYELESVQLLDQITGTPLVACDQLQVQQVDGVWHFVAGEVELLTGNFQQLLSPALKHPLTARGEANSLAIRSGSREPIDFSRVRFSLDQSNDSQQAPSKALRQVRIEAGDDFAISLSQAHHNAGPCERLTLVSTSEYVPCEWLPCPTLDSAPLTGATFRGRFETLLTTDRYADQGRATGDVRLASFENEKGSWSHGSLTLRRFEWSGPQVDRLEARIDLQAGMLSRQLVLGMNYSLSCDSFEPLREKFLGKNDASPIAYTQLASEIELDQQGLTLVAGCGELNGVQRSGAVAHAILEHQGKALLREPSVRPLPATRLVRALWHGSPIELPADSAAQAVARRLPTQAEPLPQ